VLAKNWRLCTQLAASACKICFRVDLSSTSAISKPNIQGGQLNSQKHGRGCGLANDKKYNYDVKTAFYIPLVCLSACLLSCNQVAASCMQIVPEWPPVACKLYLCGRGRQLHANFGRFSSCCMRLAATRVQFACDWRPLEYNLYATGGHSDTIYMRLAASCMKNLHALAASCVQSRQFF
jgi:hypothetical protein